MLAPDSRLFIGLLSVLTMITSLAVDMSLPALPTLGRAFATTPEMVQLTLSLFLVGYAAGQLLYGPLSDRFGRRPVMLLGIAIYASAGFACALSPSIGVLVAARLVQGLGACVGPTIARAIVRDHFGGSGAARALSTITMVMALAPLVAPLLGGALLERFGWPSIFLFHGGVGLTVGAMTWWGLGESLKRPDPDALRPRRLLANYRAFFTNRTSLGFGLMNGFTFAGLFTFISGSPFVLIDVYGVPSNRYGFYFGATALGLMVGAFASNRLGQHRGHGEVLRLGLWIMLGSALLLLLPSSTRWGGAIGLMVPIVVYILAQGLILPNALAAAMEPLPHMAGNTASLLGAMQMVLGSIAGFVVNLLYDGTALPMGAILAAMAVIAFAIYLATVRRPSAG